MLLPAIAIIDIGKTNKKFFLLDEQYKIIFEESVQLPEAKDEDGFPCEDVHVNSEGKTIAPLYMYIPFEKCTRFRLKSVIQRYFYDSLGKVYFQQIVSRSDE